MSPRLLASLLAVAALAAAAPAATARAQAPAQPTAAVRAPDLSGTWELDVARSNYGMMPAPQKGTLVIEHREPALKVTATQVSERGERTTTSSYTTDGRESRNTNAMGAEAVSVLKWEGAVLTNQTKAQMMGNDITIAERWSLAADGRTLTIARKIAAPMGEMEMSSVYTRK